MNAYGRSADHAMWACALATLLVVAVPAWAETKGDIVIGTTIPLTGIGGSTCKPIADGAAAWFRKVNDAGGVNGRSIDNIVLDDAYSAATAVSNVRELLRRKVVAIFSGCGSLQPPAIAPVLKQQNVPFLFPWAFVPGLSDNANVFLLLPSYASEMSAFVHETIKRNGAGSVYAIVQGIPGANEAVAAAKQATEKAGGTFLGSTTVTPGQDYLPVVLKSKALAPDYVVLISPSSEAAKIVTTMQAQSALPGKYVLANNSVPTQAFLSGVTDAAVRRKVLAVTVPAPATDATAQECLAAFRKYAPDLVVDAQSMTGCTNAQAMVAAIQSAGPDVTSKSLIDGLLAWKEKTVAIGVSPVTYGAGGHGGVTAVYVVGIDGDQFTTRYTLQFP